MEPEKWLWEAEFKFSAGDCKASGIAAFNLFRQVRGLVLTAAKSVLDDAESDARYQELKTLLTESVMSLATNNFVWTYQPPDGWATVTVIYNP